MEANGEAWGGEAGTGGRSTMTEAGGDAAEAPPAEKDGRMIRVPAPSTRTTDPASMDLISTPLSRVPAVTTMSR
jgi:hypothetical protein